MPRADPAIEPRSIFEQASLACHTRLQAQQEQYYSFVKEPTYPSVVHSSRNFRGDCVHYSKLGTSWQQQYCHSQIRAFNAYSFEGEALGETGAGRVCVVIHWVQKGTTN